MYTALIFMVVVAVLAAVVTVKAIAAARSYIRGEAREDNGRDNRQKTENNESGKREETQEKKETQKEDPELKKESERLEKHLDRGIDEYRFTGDTGFSIDSEKLSEEIISRSGLSSIEYENRGLADGKFFGFNIDIEEGHKMSLSYGDSVLATLECIPKENVYLDASGEVQVERYNEFLTRTYPPKLSEGMIASDVASMVDACRDLSAAEGNPEWVAAVMKERFCSSENAVRLKRNVAPKICEKETAACRQSQQRQHQAGVKV